MESTGNQFERPQTESAHEPYRHSSLDRQLVLPRLSATTIAVTLTIGFGSFVRLLGLDRWAVSPAEARIALAARGLVTGDGPIDDLAAHPATVDFVALFMFLGHTTESIGRVALATAGIAAVVLTLLLGRWMGRHAAIGSAFLIALSPTLIAVSRSMDAGGLPILLLIGILVLCFATAYPSAMIVPAPVGVLTGMLLLSGPLGPVLALFALGIVLTSGAHRYWMRDRESGFGFAAGLVGAVLLLGSAFFTRPGALVGSLGAIFESFWSDHLADFGANAHLPLWNLVLNEPAIVVLAVYGAARGAANPATRLLAAWSIISLVAFSLLNAEDVAGFAFIVLPLALLGGIGIAELFARLPHAGGTGWHAFGFVASILLLILAFVSVSLLALDGRDTVAASIVQFLLIVLVGVVPLAFAISILGSRLAGYRLPLIGLALLLLLGAFTVRSAVLTASERPGEPGELLYSEAMSSGLPTLVDTLHKISRDLTRTERSAQMPVGGVGLRVTVDERFEDTFAWYFREYPNFTVIDPTSEPLPDGTQVAILREGLDESVIAPTLRGQTYNFRFEPSPTFADPSWTALIGDAFSLSGWRSFVDYLIHRDLETDPEPVTMRILAIPQIADRMFAETGPYDLDERAGPGRELGQFTQPRGIAVADDGRIFVVDAGNGRIQRFSPDGTPELAFGAPGDGDGQLGPFPNGPGGAGGITVGSDGNLYVADTWNHRIQVFTPEGEYVTSWGGFFDAGDALDDPVEQVGLFYGPRGIAADGGGLIYVTDTGNERVQVFTEAGEFVTAFGTTGSGEGELLEPVGIAIAPTGEILVADSHNARIARFSSDGTPLDAWPLEPWEGQRFFEPYISVTSDGLIAATSSGTGEVLLLDANGTLLERLTANRLRQPYGIAVPADGSLLVTDGTNGIVVELQLPPTE